VAVSQDGNDTGGDPGQQEAAPTEGSLSGLPQAVGQVGVTGQAVVEREALKRIRQGMPWIRPDDVQRYEGDGGPFCDLFDDAGLPAGTALWDPAGPVRARLLTTTRTRAPIALLQTRLERAEHRRRHLFLDRSEPDYSAGGARLCHGEADGVPGLFLDRFGDGLLADVDAAPLFPFLDELLAGVVQRGGIVSVALRHHGQTTLTRGTSSEVRYRQAGLELEADLVKDDVRRLSAELDAMERLRSFARGRVLDVYANTGGFALHLVDAGAANAVAVDQSPHLSARVQVERARNGVQGPVDVVTADPLDWLKKSRETFDVVVCHPPHEALPRDQAERKAVEIGAAALKLVGEGAIFCARAASASLDDERFAAALQDAATGLRRRLQVLLRLGPGPDHPTLAGTPLPPSILVMRVLTTG
jgi:23S rRNA (cytosine1962-C5)-methyltransferase